MPTRIRTDAIVIGAGLAGLSAAVALSDAGLRVTVLEAGRVPGGRARSWRRHDDIVDIGPHVVHSEYANFLKFLERFGTRGQITWQPREVLTIATQPKIARLSQSFLPAPFSLLPSIARAPGLTLRDKLSGMPASLCALRFREERAQPLDSMTGLELLESLGTTPAMIDWFWRLASMAVMNVPLENVSAASLMRVHALMIGRRGAHFGFPQVGLSDLYVEQATRVVQAAGGAVLMGSTTVRTSTDDGIKVAHLSDEREFFARYLIYALPPAELGTLHPGFIDGTPFEPSPYISVYLWFDRPLTRQRFWALPWSPDRLNYDFYDLTNIRPAMSGWASVIASNIIFSHRAHGLSDDRIIEVTLDEIATFIPQARHARVQDADVHRIPMAIPCPYPGFESKRPPTTTRLPDVFLAGDWTRTQLPCSMESAVRSGFLAAEAVLAREGRARAIAIAPKPLSSFSKWVGALASHSAAARYG